MGKDKRIFVRLSVAEKEAAERACKIRGTTLSKEIRAFLARISKKAEYASLEPRND